MPRHKWTTEEQEDWLKDRCDAFKEAEKNDTRKSFYQETYAAWLFKWPNPEPSAKQIADATTREATIKKIYVDQEKVSCTPNINLLISSYPLSSDFKPGIVTVNDLP